MPRHILPALLVVAGVMSFGLPARAQNPLSLLDAPKLAPTPSSIGLPPSIQEERDGKAASGAKAKKPAARSGASQGTAGSTRGETQALRAPGTAKSSASADRPPPRRESEAGSDGPGVPRLQPSLDASTGRMGLGGRF
jgi:hypothetical protein